MNDEDRYHFVKHSDNLFSGALPNSDLDLANFKKNGIVQIVSLIPVRDELKKKALGFGIAIRSIWLETDVDPKEISKFILPNKKTAVCCVAGFASGEVCARIVQNAELFPKRRIRTQVKRQRRL